MIPMLPLPEEEQRRLAGEWLAVSALPETRDVHAVAEKYARALAVSEIMLQRLKGVPVLSICFSLAAACAYRFQNRRDKALPLVEQAVDLALQDRLYIILSDFAIYLDGMVEACLQKRDPAALKLVRRVNSALVSERHKGLKDGGSGGGFARKPDRPRKGDRAARRAEHAKQ